MITRKARSDNLTEVVGLRPLSTDSIERPTTGAPSKSYPHEAQGLPLSKITHLRLHSSLSKSAARQPTGTQGESRSLRSIGVPPPVSRPSGTVSVLRARHALLRPYYITIVINLGIK